MSEDVAFDGQIVKGELQNFQENLCGVEIENWQKHLRHVQFGLEEPFVQLITLDVSVNSFVIGCEDLIFVHLDKVKRNIVSICFNGIREVLDNKRCFRNLQELDRQSELPGQDKNLDDFFWNNVLVHVFKETKSLLMGKDNVGINHILFFSLIFNHN